MFKKFFTKGQKGFTLIELLVVISILGILTAIAVPSVASLMGSGKEEAEATETANVQTAVDAWMASKAYAYATTDGKKDGTLITTTTLLDAEFLRSATHGTYEISLTGLVKNNSYD